MSKNSFKELEEQQVEQYKKNTDKIKTRVDGTLGTIGLFTDIIELYFSRLLDVFLNMGSNSTKSESLGINSKKNISSAEEEE